MASEDELAKRRYDKLVARVESLMRESLTPEYEGFYGDVRLAEADIEELGGDLAEIRRAARAAGRHLGWKTVTREIDGRIFIADDREAPQAVRDLAARRSADAVAALVEETREGRRPRPV
ncbi:hypothetical protein ACFO3J_01960 [Streptomyces polygonati]|uniref:Uncharacterized protein n=1 Tax=Streptomyces polygonati TaxID=1617087 RepID=A0ABV8HFI8_9ACTN